MGFKKLREKKRVFGKGRMAWIAAISLIGLFLSFTISNLGFCQEQMSEGVILKSPLVWRTDEGGDYLLSQMSANETYELTSPVTSEGRIKTMTATWEFKGEVSLEVSANNGVDYTPVVNGVPFPIPDTSSGNQLKWKATLGFESELTEVRITYTEAKDVLSTFGSSQLSGFKFRKLLTISNPSGKELFNYQLKIKVGESAGTASFDAHCEGNIQADFKDVRFTAADGETLLSYYLENTIGDTPIGSAIYYVKIPQLPEQGLSIYLYYANPDARDISDAESVFDFFDHFGEELDSAKWDSQTNFEGECEVNNSFLKLDSAKIISKDYRFADGIIEYRAKAEAGYEIRAIIREDKEKIDHTQLVYSSVYEGAEHSVAVGDIVKVNASKPLLPAVFYDFRIIAQGENLSFERYGLGYNELEASVSFQDMDGLTKGYIGLEVGGVGSGESIAYYDWLRVRKFVEAEPYISALADEEAVKLAEFSGTTLAGNGNIVSLNTHDSILNTQYTTAPLFTACNITAITPQWTAENYELSMDISADGGASWREDCVSGKTYSAPFDFAVGGELLLRANLSIGDTNTTSELEQIKLEYSVAPKVTSANTRCWGATGEGGVYISGDAIVVEWDNSSQGDNNPDVLSVSCNFEPFGGDAQTTMSDDDNDGIYTVRYELPEGIKTTSNIFVTAANLCGVATRDGHILSVDTMTDDRGQETEDEGEETEEEAETVFPEEIAEEHRRPNTELYDLLIKLGDNYNSDPEKDARACYKEGDIVVVRLTGHSWSKTERSSFLIVQAYLTEEEARQLTRSKQGVTGEVDESGRLVRRMLRRRAKRIDLSKLGLSEEEGQRGWLTGKKAQKLRAIRSGLKGKTLKRELIEEKK